MKPAERRRRQLLLARVLPFNQETHSDAQHQQDPLIAENINSYFSRATFWGFLCLFFSNHFLHKLQCNANLQQKAKRQMAQLSEECLQEHIICLQIKMPSLCQLFSAISGLAAFSCNARQRRKQTFFFLSLASSSGEIK